MALQPMYPAQNNSPRTSLAAALTAGATSITLVSASGLPAAPGLLVLGVDVDAEVIKYTGISGNILTGVSRGFGGTTAKAWPAGTIAARNFTAYDHEALMANITDLDTVKAPLASPTLTGTPKAPTATKGTNTTQLATTAFVAAGLADKQDNLTFDSTPTASSTNPVTSGGVKSALDLKANLASPTLTGTPKAPTATKGTNTTQIATTAFVATGLADKQDNLTFDSTPTASSTNPVTSGGVKSALDLKANLASPTLTGIPKAPTATKGTNTTQIATTAFVAAGLADKQDNLTFDSTPTAGSTNPVTSGGVKSALDLKANLASPTLTGTPKAPTATKGTSTTQLATTAFVAAGLADKQDTLTFDSTPTASSTNPVTSGGIYTALAGKLDLHGTADLSGGVSPVLMAGNEDLNDLRPVNNTWYYCTDSTNIVNKPYTATNAFGMIVYRLANTTFYQILIRTNGDVYSRRLPSGSAGRWQQWPVGISGAGYHNSIYRGMNLGTEVTTEQYAAISAGTFENLYIGDYWTINNITWRIAGCNYLQKSGQTTTSKNHLLIFPDNNLLESDGSTQYMNTTNTTEGGYNGTIMRSTYLPQCLSIVESAFGASHILKHYEYISNAVADGVASGGSWVQTKIEIPSEAMVFGNTVNGHAINGNYNMGNMWQQMPLAVYAPETVRNRLSYWLRDIVSATAFSAMHAHGYAAAAAASNSSTYGVRPFFLLYGE